jgi:uncharacterized protein YjbI with pentapeptide repeats
MVDRVGGRAAAETDSTLSDADWYGEDLSGAMLERVDLSRCDVRGSDLTALDPLSADVHDMIVDVDQAVLVARLLGLDVRAD